MNEKGARYVLIGGYAGIVHGSALATEDIDVCVPLDQENVAKIMAALGDLHLRFRMRPDKPEVPSDPARLAGFKNLYLVSDIGRVDMLSEVTGIGSFDEVMRHTQVAEIEGQTFRVLNFGGLNSRQESGGSSKGAEGGHRIGGDPSTLGGA
jgi:hypothetical protein